MAYFSGQLRVVVGIATGEQLRVRVRLGLTTEDSNRGKFVFAVPRIRSRCVQYGARYVTARWVDTRWRSNYDHASTLCRDTSMQICWQAPNR